MIQQEFSPFWESDKCIISKDSLNIILLAHVQQPRGSINIAQLQCSKTERFSIEEFYEIYQGIVDAGYYIQAVYYNELDFISDFMEHPERFKHCLIYNLARNGLGNNKKTVIPAFCELVGLKYSTSSSLTCALCRNKYYFTTLIRSHNIPVPQSWLLNNNGEWEKDSPPDGLRVICKPVSESASQGVTQAGIFDASPSMFKRYRGTQYIVQEYIEGAECEVPLFKVGDSIMVMSPVGINLNGNKILDEKNSAENNYGFYRLKDTQTAFTIDKIKNYAEKVFRLLQMDIYGRIDFRIDSKGMPYIFDIATTPYTTRHSSFSFAFDQLSLCYSDIYRAVISAALWRQNDKN